MTPTSTTPPLSAADDSLRAPISAASSRTRIGLGLLQGLLLYGLYYSSTAKVWPATTPMLFVPMLMLAVLLPIAAISGIGHLSPRNLSR